MNNTNQIIDNHNKPVLNSPQHIDDIANSTNTKDNKTCNCRQKNTCPLNGRNCLQTSVICQATVTRKAKTLLKHISDSQKADFKTRCRNHTASFRHIKHRNATELSKHIWTLKESNADHFISKKPCKNECRYNELS